MVQRPGEQIRKNEPTGRDKKPVINSNSEAKHTGALPLWAAGVCVGEDGQAQQAALGLGGVVATVQRRVVKQQLPVEADQLGTLVNTVRIRRLGRQWQTY